MFHVKRIMFRGSDGNALLVMELHLSDPSVSDETVREAIPRFMQTLRGEGDNELPDQPIDFKVVRRGPSTVIVRCRAN